MKNIRTASAIMLVMIAIFACLTSGSILADDAPEIDEWLYCNDEIKWGPACGINLQCGE